MAMDARQERSVSKASNAFVISSWQWTPGKKGVYQKHQMHLYSLHGNGRQARKECIKSIKSISNLFMAMDARLEMSVSKVFLISSWRWTPSKKGVYQKHQMHLSSLHGNGRQAKKERVVARHLFLLCFPPRDLLFPTHVVHM